MKLTQDQINVCRYCRRWLSSEDKDLLAGARLAVALAFEEDNDND